MKEVFEFPQKAGVFYVATIDGNQPRVRPLSPSLSLKIKSILKVLYLKNVKASINSFTESSVNYEF